MSSKDHAEKVLTGSVENAIRNTVDRNNEENARVAHSVGLEAKIVRTMNGETCKWCAEMAGTYEYSPKMNRDVFRRHDNCDCTVEYICEKGLQDVWSKKWKTETTEERRSRIRDDRSYVEKLIQEREDAKALRINEGSHKGKIRLTEIARSKIDSADYGRRMSRVDESRDVTNSMTIAAKDILHHRNGTLYEDLMFVDTRTGKYIVRTDYNHERSVLPSKRMRNMLNNAPDYTIAALHNHPGSTPPSPQDIRALFSRKNAYGVVICHDGSIYKYSIDLNNFNEAHYTAVFDELDRSGYTQDNISKFIEDSKDAGVIIEVL